MPKEKTWEYQPLDKYCKDLIKNDLISIEVAYNEFSKKSFEYERAELEKQKQNIIQKVSEFIIESKIKYPQLDENYFEYCSNYYLFKKHLQGKKSTIPKNKFIIGKNYRECLSKIKKTERYIKECLENIQSYSDFYNSMYKSKNGIPLLEAFQVVSDFIEQKSLFYELYKKIPEHVAIPHYRHLSYCAILAHIMVQHPKVYRDEVLYLIADLDRILNIENDEQVKDNSDYRKDIISNDCQKVYEKASTYFDNYPEYI